MRAKALAISLSLTLFCVPALAGNIVINGSFESSPITPPTNPGFSTFINGDSYLTGWSIDSGSIDYIGTYWQNQDGNRSLDMSGNGPGSISQVLTTIIDQEYEVVFWMAGNPDGPPDSKTLVVVAGVSQTFTQNKATRTNMGWTMKSFTFTATGTSTAISFTSQDNTAYGPALDNVSVTAVPLPAAAWMGLAVLGGLGAVRRLRRSRR